MSLAHIKKHWLKYYLGTGVAWAGYSYFAYGNPGVMGLAQNVALWPYKAYQAFTAQVSVTPGDAVISGG